MESKNLNGFHPSRKRGGAVNSTGFNRYQIAQNNVAAIFTGDLVKLSGGYVTPITTTTDYAVGVVMGVRYVDKTSKQPVWSGYIAASGFRVVTELTSGTDHDATYSMFAVHGDLA